MRVQCSKPGLKNSDQSLVYASTASSAAIVDDSSTRVQSIDELDFDGLPKLEHSDTARDCYCPHRRLGSVEAAHVIFDGVLSKQARCSVDSPAF